jgi:hypothetical protein
LPSKVVRALLDGGDHGVRVHLGERRVAGQHIAQRRAAAGGGQDAGDVGALLLEVALVHGDRERHAIGRDAVIADDNAFGPGGVGRGGGKAGQVKQRQRRSNVDPIMSLTFMLTLFAGAASGVLLAINRRMQGRT